MNPQDVCGICLHGAREHVRFVDPAEKKQGIVRMRCRANGKLLENCICCPIAKVFRKSLIKHDIVKKSWEIAKKVTKSKPKDPWERKL